MVSSVCHSGPADKGSFSMCQGCSETCWCTSVRCCGGHGQCFPEWAMLPLSSGGARTIKVGVVMPGVQLEWECLQFVHFKEIEFQGDTRASKFRVSARGVPASVPGWFVLNETPGCIPRCHPSFSLTVQCRVCPPHTSFPAVTSGSWVRQGYS